MKKKILQPEKKVIFPQGPQLIMSAYITFFFIYIELTNTIGKEIRAKSLIPK